MICSVICKSIFYQEEVKQSVKALDYREEVLLYKMHTLRVTKTKIVHVVKIQLINNNFTLLVLSNMLNTQSQELYVILL